MMDIFLTQHPEEMLKNDTTGATLNFIDLQ